MMLNELKPTERRRVYDLLAQAGVDTTDWANYSGTNPAANPKYCYQWAFEGEHVAVVNVWHRDIKLDALGAYLTGNMRKLAAQDPQPVRRTRAEEFDRAIRRSFENARALRLIICEGPNRPDGRPARAAFRLLDQTPWFTAKYHADTGEFVMRRGERPGSQHTEYLPEELPPSTKYREGVARQILVNAYERNQVARQECLQHYGATCSVCGMEFAKVYGAVASGYMHVHHLTPLSDIGGDYEVDPVRDLRPVCPNCHAVIHLGGECRDIEHVAALLRTRRLEA